MPYVSEIELLGYNVKLCACDVVAEGLYKGTRYSHDHGRRIPVNRYLCEQCADNMRDMDDADIRLVKAQRLSEEVWEAFEAWYQENAS